MKRWNCDMVVQKKSYYVALFLFSAHTKIILLASTLIKQFYLYNNLLISEKKESINPKIMTNIIRKGLIANFFVLELCEAFTF